MSEKEERSCKRRKICNPKISPEVKRKSQRVELLTRRGLLPPSVRDDELATIHFQREFRQRFGTICPQFFVGSLENAIIRASGQSIDEEKLLAIFLHHDGSIHGDRFCIQHMCLKSTADVLDNNFIVWAWDVTEENNRQRFLLKSSLFLDNGLIYDLTRAQKDKFPMLIVVRCRRNQTKAIQTMKGGATYKEFSDCLKDQVLYSGQERKIAKENDKQRAIRDSILEQQRKEYEKSLKEDQEKDRLKEKAEKINSTTDIHAKKIKPLKLEDPRTRKLELNKLKKLLPKEPKNSKNVIKIRFRKPSGEGCLNRIFSRSDKLQDLINFVTSEGFPAVTYRIVSVCPRREISSLNPKRVLQHYGLARQETLIIEEKV